MSSAEPKTFPIQTFIERNLTRSLLAQYLDHIEPLAIQLWGTTLLVGVGETGLEFAVVENQLAHLTKIDILTYAFSPGLFVDMLNQAHGFPRAQMHLYPQTLQNLLEQQGLYQYESLLWTGVSPATLTPEIINTIGSHLAHGGTAYLTIQDYPEAASPWQHSHLDLNVIPNLPPHPISPPELPYFGLIVENHT
ncbi:MAG: hypothetical protein HYS86_03405 [Candidatus Chisholmbacteria bacterium]|nr:hypothetical protein [Candidatus Chisholmbacteria bacterium]